MELEKTKTWLNYYKESLHRIAEVVLFYRETGNLVNWNLAAVKELGYDGEELSHIGIQEILKNEAEELFCLNEEFVSMTGYEQCKKEVNIYRKNGTFYTGEVKWLIVDDVEVHGICIIKNVQSMREAEKELKATKEEIEDAIGAKTLFVANVTHELRTPLNGIKGMTALLLESPLNEEQKENLQIMERCIGNMEEIINELLDFSKIQAGRLQLEKVSFTYGEWMKEIIEMNRSLARGKGLTMEYHGAKDIPNILVGDSFRLRQVMNNLLSNAIKFTPTGGISVEVTVMEGKGEQIRLHFAISDTGIGICPEEKEHLFQSFSQADPSITRKYGGTGLGLAICKAIVEEMDGTIEVENNSPQGSRFLFTVLLERGTETVGQPQSVTQQEYVAQTQPVTQQEVALQPQPVAQPQQGIGFEEEPFSLNKLIQKIGFCIELTSWDKAEEMVHLIKLRTKESDKEMSRQAFRLELALRKRNKEDIHERYEALLKRIKDSKEADVWNRS